MAMLLTPVKSKLFIHSSRKSTHALDGAHASLMRGRSMDFEDLRSYEYGDPVRDIDWRATARFGEPLVKRTRANRMHTVLFVVDTGVSMSALAFDEKPKRELAVLTVGALGLLTLRHGDDFAVVFGDSHSTKSTAIGRSESALEHALRDIDTAIAGATQPSSREELLRTVIRSVKRRMIVVVVTDESPIDAESERLLRRIRVQHDVLWATLNDARPVLESAKPGARTDVVTGWSVPDFVHGDTELVRELARLDAEIEAARARVLDGLEIDHVALGSQDEAVPQLLHMLNRRSHARAR
ncbi:DUF58 domain-containing protein [Microbacterium sp. YY-01]|uniref:DUF58 domain-containing protein n=1 Tax=Microbacterium sp. YY-01 TaxID=3421634 RepID=UPI003D163F6A